MRATISKNTRCPLKIIKKNESEVLLVRRHFKIFFKNTITHLKIISCDTTHPLKIVSERLQIKYLVVVPLLLSNSSLTSKYF
jgi:hypothetical protein